MLFTPRTRFHWVALAVFVAGLCVVLYLAERTQFFGPSHVENALTQDTSATRSGAGAGSAADNASEVDAGLGAFANGAAVGSGAPWWRLAPQVSAESLAKLISPAHAVPSFADRVLRAFPVEQTVAGGINGVLNAPGALGIGGNTRVSFALPGGRRIAGEVKLAQREDDGRLLLGGRLDDGGTFSLARLEDGALVGRILPGGPVDFAYVLEIGRDGRVYLLEKDRDAVLCVNRVVVPARADGVAFNEAESALGGTSGGSPADESLAETATAAAAAANGDGASASDLVPQSAAPVGQPIAQSEAAAIIFLDFDGETVTDSSWNGGETFTVADADMTASQIGGIVKLVQEDYAPFNILVTTDPAVYAAAPARKRMRCIATTSTSWWSGSGGGVAYTNSWNTAGYSFSSTVPCWVVTSRLGKSVKSVADAISHEVGHTLGLSHDGIVGGTDSYYDGNETETPSWAPIMGNSYSVTLSQWSKGEYTKNGVAANNTENDLAIISSIKNHAGYKDDDVSSVNTSSMSLLNAGATTVSKSGIIERTGDIDSYMFATSGAVSFALASGTWIGERNLDAKLIIKDFAGTTLVTADPENSIYPTINTTLPAGVYVLQITGASKGTGVEDGYSNYGSLGAYRITGTVAVTSAFVPRVGGWLNTTAQVGVPLTYQIQTAGNPTSYTASNLPPGLLLNATTGVISGTPTTAGTYTIGLRATNAAGTSTVRNAVFNFLPDTYAGALDTTALTFTSGGTEPWEIVDDDETVGNSSVRAGQITHGRTSWIETTLPGAGVLTFWWKVSSETDGDFLRYKVDGSTILSISGMPAWEQLTRTLAGPRTIRWSYEKNSTTSSNSDTAWLDGITFTMKPDITSATTARMLVGTALNYTITSAQPIDSSIVTGLPEGITFNSTTGVISGTPTLAGNYPITISTTNVAGTSTATFNLTVLTSYAVWLETKGIPTEGGLDGSGVTADSDDDGRPDLMEYALDSNPLLKDNAGGPSVVFAGSGDDTHLEISFEIPETRAGVRYVVEVSSDLVNWTRGHVYGEGAVNGSSLPTTEVSTTSIGNGRRKLTVRDAAASGSGAGVNRRFIRLKVELTGN